MKLAVLPTTTTFCSATIPLFEGLEFFVDGNSKITRENGSYAEPRPNAFSLPAASVVDPYSHVGAARPCPGSTPTCRASCYVRGLAQHAPDLYARYQGNADALAVVLRTDRGFYHSALKLAQWIEEHASRGFRWHVSGDILNAEHARWIVEVCALAPQVPFWIYTRTLATVPRLSTAFNLAVNVSADVDNYADARAVAAANGARICYLTETAEHVWEGFHENAPRWCPRCDRYENQPDADGACIPRSLPPDSVIFPDYALRGRSLEVPTSAAWWQSLTAEQRKQVCPTDFFGQSEAHRCGPCTKCF